MLDERNDHPDEESPLLQSARDNEQKITALPKVQISILLLLQLVEPICALCIIPFINQLISELDITGGDEKKVGYYVGIIWFTFFLAEAVCVLQWNRLSDRVGRKPVLLTGLAGLFISMISFGLSQTFIGLVLSRTVAGLTNGNVGVIKSMMAEITDSTNIAQAFALLPLVWATGVTVGPLVGGILSRPYDRFPSLFGTQFWKTYPYFLPCLFSACFAAFAWVICLLFLNETVHRRAKSRTEVASHSQESSEDTVQVEDDDPPSLRSLLKAPVIITITNYFFICLLEICWIAIMPLVYSTPINLGGLGMDPAMIGTSLAVYGIMGGVLQGLFFPIFVRRFGPKFLYMSAMVAFVLIFAMFPILGLIARTKGYGLGLWGAIAFQLFCAILVDAGYGAVYMYISTSVPTKRGLGGVNGMAQTIASFSRALGPAGASALYALSLERQWLGGDAVFVVLVGASAVGLAFSFRLPQQVWKH